MTVRQRKHGRMDATEELRTTASANEVPRTRQSNLGMAFAVLASAYFLAHFHRISLGVLALDLKESLNTGAQALSLLSAGYFYVYGALQIPIGLLADRYGVRLLSAGLSFVAAIGSVLLALAPSFPVALVGRLLVGAGVSGAYVSALRFFARRLPPRRFATAVGILVAVGNAGGLAATTPLVFLNAMLGWRATFLVVAAMSLIVAMLAWALIDDKPEMCGGPVRDVPRIKGGNPESHLAATSVREILGSRTLVKAALTVAGRYGPHVAFLGVWGSLYLRTVHSLSPVVAGNVLMAMSVGYAAGGPALGYASDRLLGHKAVLVASTAVCAMGWVPLLAARNPLPAFSLFCLALVMGVAGGGGAVAFSMAKESVQHARAGTAVALVNTTGFLGSAVFQSITGFLLDGCGSMPAIDAAVFRSVITLSMIGSLVSLVCALGAEESLKRAEGAVIPVDS